VKRRAVAAYPSVQAWSHPFFLLAIVAMCVTRIQAPSIEELLSWNILKWDLSGNDMELLSWNEDYTWKSK
jgi:hypothetical protein